MQMALIHFGGWVILHCVYVPHLLYPFLCWWTLRLLSCPGCCEQCCSKHGVHVSFGITGFSGYVPRVGVLGHMVFLFLAFWGTFILFSTGKVSVAQSCLTLCDPMDCSPPEPFVHGIILARILEWVTIPFSRRSSQPRDRTQVSFKGDQAWVFFGRNDAKAETPVLWLPHVKSWLIGKDSDAGRDWGQKEKGTTEDEMAGWYHRLDGHEFEWTPGAGDGQGGLVCCDSWGCKELDTTERLN